MHITGIIGWALTDYSKGDKQTVEIAQKHVAGKATDRGGIVLGMKDMNNYLLFQIRDNAFSIYLKADDQGKNVVDWTSSPAIKVNLNEVNTLKVTLADGKLQFYINDQKVQELNAGSIEVLDSIGYECEKVNSSTLHTTYHINYVKAWKNRS